MQYQIVYYEGRPSQVLFEPKLSNSDGSYDHELGRKYLSKEYIPGWGWDGQYLSSYLSDDDDIPSMVDKAQQMVYQFMNELFRLRQLLRVLGIGDA